jgi:hypothetical protein
MTLRVLSLGAGVQSSTILLMACHGEEQIDAAIFADTGWEPSWVYEHLDWLERTASDAGIPLYRVSGGDLRSDALANKPEAWMPLWSTKPDGTSEQLRRQCTKNYKIVPLRRKVRELNGGSRRLVQQFIGISLDEYQRIRTSDVQYITHVYPLIERRMTRADCVRWLSNRGYPVPRKSSCIACPLRSVADWRDIKSHARSWADAVDFDERIRHVRSNRAGGVFVQRSRNPLVEVDLRSEQDQGQLEFEFDGCGVLCASNV